MQVVDYQAYAKFLPAWLAAAQQQLFKIPQRPDLLCYGPGYNHWGVQTNQKAFSAFAVAASDPSLDWTGSSLAQGQVLDQALALLRFSLESHIEGSWTCNDGEKWGHTWISALGLERMMHGVEAIWQQLTEADHALLRKVLISEADWLLEHYKITAGLVEDNRPESNIWNGAILARVMLYYPDLANQEKYKEKASRFLINGISKESDADSATVYNGIKVKDAFIGANFFDSMACNHHRYLNIGYMVICLSNIAMLHFSFKARGQAAPPELYHNVPELWQLVRTCSFPDGRLWRIGGDTRVRYCYCQDYALPMWALLQDKYQEDCSGFLEGWLDILQKEISYNGDGSFLSCRLDYMQDESPLYYTRLEADRANVISMLAYWSRLHQLKGEKTTPELASWQDDYHGAILLKEKKRLVSFTWLAAQRPQAMLLPPQGSDFAEWRQNLAGEIKGQGQKNENEILEHQTESFPGGFLTYGRALAKSSGFLAEGQTLDRQAEQLIAFAALPDQATVISLQRAVASNLTLITSVKGIGWRLPNDIFNDTVRCYEMAAGQLYAKGGEKTDAKNIPAGSWLNVDQEIGLATAGPEQLTIVRPAQRLALDSLYCDEIVSCYQPERKWYDKGELIYETGFGLTLGPGQKTRQLAASLKTLQLGEDILALKAQGQDGRDYLLACNIGPNPKALQVPAATSLAGTFTGQLASGQAVLLQLN